MEVRHFFGEVKKEEQSRTLPLPHFSQVAPQSRLKVHKKLSKAPQSKGLRSFSTPPSFPTSPPTPPHPYRSSLKEVYWRHIKNCYGLLSLLRYSKLNKHRYINEIQCQENCRYSGYIVHRSIQQIYLRIGNKVKTNLNLKIRLSLFWIISSWRFLCCKENF